MLVGHNVAFDLKEIPPAERGHDRSSVATNPVLDTLLLATLVYPDSDVHSLEALARLVGVEVTGRHTSLGDALVTAELFLQLIPLLEARGLKTFGEASRQQREKPSTHGGVTELRVSFPQRLLARGQELPPPRNTVFRAPAPVMINPNAG